MKSIVVWAVVITTALIPIGVNAVTLIPNPQNGRECTAPSSQRLVDQLQRVQPGSSAETVENMLGRSNQGYVAYRDVSGAGVMHWTQQVASGILWITVGFQDRKADYREVAIVSAPGTPQERICSWTVPN